MGGFLSQKNFSNVLGREVIIMDDFFGLFKEVLKGIVRAISAHLFQKTFLNKAKTTRSRDKQKGGSQK